MWDRVYLFVMISCSMGLLYPTLLAAFSSNRWDCLRGEGGMTAVRGGSGELRRMLWRAWDGVYGGLRLCPAENCVPICSL